ncbi:hypothetical protein HN51_058623 [Arachis hypogaea]
MDPNRARNTDYINAYGFGDDGGTLLSDFNDWDLHGQYNHPFDLTPSNAFDRFDADTFGLHAHAVLNSGSSEPFVPPSSASHVEKSMSGSAFGAVVSMADPFVEDIHICNIKKFKKYIKKHPFSMNKKHSDT